MYANKTSLVGAAAVRNAAGGALRSIGRNHG